MKTRLVTAATIAGALALSLSGAQAATPTLDGKKVKTLSASFTPAPQDNDAAAATDQAPGAAERVACAAPRCGRVPFVYKPAKGVKGGVSFKISWSLPGEDMDLYVAEIAKDGSASLIASCGASAGTSEQLLVDSSAFKSGKTYALVADFYRATGRSVTATVSLPGAVNNKSTAPAAIDDVLPTNCGL